MSKSSVPHPTPPTDSLQNTFSLPTHVLSSLKTSRNPFTAINVRNMGTYANNVKTLRCFNCARAHPVTKCNYPNDPHCVSCGTSSRHASSDRGNCPQFSRHMSTINAHLLENSMPYFPILGQPSTFTLAVKPIHTHSTNYSNHPQPQTNLSNAQQQQQ